MASSSSEEEMARFLPLDAGGAGALDLAGDFADDGPDSEEGRGRAGGCALTLPVKNVNDHIKKGIAGHWVPSTFVFGDESQIDWLDINLEVAAVQTHANTPCTVTSQRIFQDDIITAKCIGIHDHDNADQHVLQWLACFRIHSRHHTRFTVVDRSWEK